MQAYISKSNKDMTGSEMPNNLAVKLMLQQHRNFDWTMFSPTTKDLGQVTFQYEHMSATYQKD